MAQATNGNIVKVHYTGKLENGTVFDTSLNRDPLQFQIGEGQLIPGFEEAVIGMKVGESKTTKVPPDKAFGEYQPEKVHLIDHSNFPDDVHVGQQYQIGSGESEPQVVTVTEIAEESVKVDGNHLLAGQNLIFDIQLLEVR